MLICSMCWYVGVLVVLICPCWGIDVLICWCSCAEVSVCWCWCVDFAAVLMCCAVIWWCVEVLLTMLMVRCVVSMCWYVLCVDMLACWLCWYVPVLRYRCVDMLVFLCWGIGVLMLICWFCCCVDALCRDMMMCWGVADGVDGSLRCFNVLICWFGTLANDCCPTFRIFSLVSCSKIFSSWIIAFGIKMLNWRIYAPKFQL